MNRRTDLIERLQGELSGEARAALVACVRVCEERGGELYLAGGAVRDLLRGAGHVDLDLTMEAETAPIASAVADAMGARAVTHARFGTATVKGAGYELDLAQTRRERYAQPGALPDVEPASLQEDLARRDFSIAAMALRLTEPAGELIDPFGGQRDLEARQMRVLHEASFQDDATRILRAVRYATRLGFEIEASTAGWLTRDLGYIDRISGARLRRELLLLLREESAVDAAVLAQELGVLASIHPALRLTRAVAEGWRVALARPHRVAADELGLCVLLEPATGASATAVATRLHLTARQEKALLDLARLESLSSSLKATREDGVAAVAMLDGKEPAAIEALAIREGGDTAAACEAYLAHWRHIRPLLRGGDVVALGLSAGPAVGEMLSALRAARLRGQVETREDEIELVKRELGMRGG